MLICQQWTTPISFLCVSKLRNKEHFLHVNSTISLTNTTESMRHAWRDMKNASGHARALEAVSSHTKKHGRRNKKSQNCKYCIKTLCVHVYACVCNKTACTQILPSKNTGYQMLSSVRKEPYSLWRSQGLLLCLDWINPVLLLSFYLEGVWLSHPWICNALVRVSCLIQGLALTFQ